MRNKLLLYSVPLTGSYATGVILVAASNEEQAKELAGAHCIRTYTHSYYGRLELDVDPDSAIKVLGRALNTQKEAEVLDSWSYIE